MIHPVAQQGYALNCFMLMLLLLLGENGLSPSAGAETTRSFRWMVGSTSRQEEAQQTADEVGAKISQPVFVDYFEGLYRVTLGQFSSFESASSLEPIIQQTGFSSASLVEIIESSEVVRVKQVLYHIHIDSYANEDQAKKVEEDFRKRGFSPVGTIRAGSYYTVRVGMYTDRDQATEDMKALRQTGYPYCWLFQSNRMESRTEKRIKSIHPATHNLLYTPDTQPDKNPPGTLYQVIVGPFAKQDRAEDLLSVLRLKGYDRVQLVRTAQGYEIEIGEPLEADPAGNLVKQMRDKGMVEAVFRKRIPAEVIVEAVAEPATTAPASIPGSTPTGKPDQTLKVAEHLRAARSLLNSGEIEAARDQYALALELAPRSSEAMDGMAETRRRLQELLEKEQEERIVETMLEQAEALVTAQEYNAARIQYNQILQRQPGNPEARRMLKELDRRFEVQSTQTLLAAVASVTPIAEAPIPPDGTAELAPRETTDSRSLVSVAILGSVATALSPLLLFVVYRRIQSARKGNRAKTLSTAHVGSKPPRGALQDLATEYRKPLKTAPQKGTDQSSSPLLESVTDKQESETALQSPNQKNEDQILYELSLEKYLDGETVPGWMGEYDFADLIVETDPEFAGVDSHIRFEKRPSTERALFSIMLPPVEHQGVFEFSVSCLQINEYPMGVYLESVDDETFSLPWAFRTHPDSGELESLLGRSTLNLQLRTWYSLMIQVDLDQHRCSIWLDQQLIEEDFPLRNKIRHLEILSAVADAQCEGVLLIRTIRLRQNKG